MNFCPLKRYTFNSLGLQCNAETFCAIFKHCGFEKKLYCFGRENSNDTLDRIFFISNQRKTPFSSMFASVVCFSKWQKQKPNANFTAVVPKLLRRLFSLSKTHHVSTFLLFLCRDSRSRIIGPQAFSALPRNLSLCPSLMVA